MESVQAAVAAAVAAAFHFHVHFQSSFLFSSAILLLFLHAPPLSLQIVFVGESDSFHSASVNVDDVDLSTVTPLTVTLNSVSQ